ncbi:MAG: hypothetical protein H6741_04570 [Alphaproteobacteria bacterium]|nr:hypothetical protein [Alphaproteobacteria bacterium]MCB9791981.1 hypothetical protein [Alphaproteobacteria bacterium]
MSSLALLLVPLAAAGWTEAGPERGHVLDAAVGGSQVSVASRVGVLSAALGPELTWTRDPRFPGDTRRLAYAPGQDSLAWVAVPGGLWRLEGEDLEPVWSDPRSTVVDLVAGPEVAWAAVRGEQAGLWRAPAQGPAERTLELDPWCLSLDGDRLLIGTVDGQVLTGPPESLSALQRLPAAVSACAWFEGAPWVASAEGALYAGTEQVLRLDDGVIVGLSPSSQGLVAAVEGRAGGQNRLIRVVDGQALPLRGGAAEDPGKVDWTGLTALPDGDVLVGTFRRGPARVHAGTLRPAQAGFRATVLGGVDVDAQGRLLLALMGTGVYAREPDGRWIGLHGSTTAVTDSVAVVEVSEGLVVLDFNGLGLWRRDGGWTRIAGPGEQLTDLVEGPEGDWWALDRRGGLRRWDGAAWSSCAGPRGFHLDGRGADARLFSAEGLHRPGDCAQGWPREATPGRIDPLHARADGGLLAAPGGLWRGEERLRELPQAPVSALLVEGERWLVGFKDGRVLDCAQDPCVLLVQMPGEVGAIGVTGDGRRWIVEAAGTLWLEGGGAAPAPWPRRYVGRFQGDFMSLERAPWGSEAGGNPGPGAAPPAPRPAPAPPTATPPPAPKARDPLGAVLGLFGLVLGFVLAALTARRAGAG